MGDSGTSIGDDEQMQAVEGQLIEADHTLKLPKRIRLGSLREVRREMAAVYESVRRMKLPSQEGTRLIYMLVQIGNLIRDSELEERITKLEQQQNEKSGSKNYPT